MLEWLNTYIASLTVLIYTIVRLMESVQVLAENKTAVKLTTLLKEFFRFG